MPDETTTPEVPVVETPVVPETPVPNLDELRDQHCLPVAQGVLEDIAEKLLPEVIDGTFTWTPLVTKILERSLEADLNITTEVSYIPQLVLSALSGLNTAMQDCEATPVDELRYVGIAKKLLVMIAEAHLTLTKIKPEEQVLEFAPIKEKISILVKEENLNRLEVKYIMDMVFESFKRVSSIFEHSLGQSVARAESKIFGVESMSDVTMKKLDGFLKAE